MDGFTIRLDNDMYLQFIGEELAHALDVDLGITYVIYKTSAGKLLCQIINSVIYADEYKYAFVKTIGEVVKFFGMDDLAQKLYEEAGIELI